MMDGVDQILQEFEKTVAAASAEAFARLRAIMDAAKVDRPDDRPDLGIKDLMPAAAGAELAHRSKGTMTAWCRRHQIVGGAGFAVRIGGRWFVSRSRLVKHLADSKPKSNGASDKPALADTFERFRDCASDSEAAMLAASEQ
jgi:hypothetical protein